MTEQKVAPELNDDESLRSAAVLGLNALHECIVPKGAETQISDAMRALRSAIDNDTRQQAMLARVGAERSGTPAAAWRVAGEPDPHAGHYDGERANLALGNLTDDELANGAFMNYDRPMDIEAILRHDKDYHPPIAWMTAVKDRIRWLSRKLESISEELSALKGTPAAAEQKPNFFRDWSAVIKSLPMDGSAPAPSQIPAGFVTAAAYDRLQALCDAQAERLLAATEAVPNYERMFNAACLDLAAINEKLGLDPDDGGATPIIDEIDALLARAKPAAAVADSQEVSVLAAALALLVAGGFVAQEKADEAIQIALHTPDATELPANDARPSSNPGPLAAVEVDQAEADYAFDAAIIANDALASIAAANERDAERYQWIRERLSVRIGVVTEGMNSRGAWLLQLSPVEVEKTALIDGPDAAVDAAIAASKEGAAS